MVTAAVVASKDTSERGPACSFGGAAVVSMVRGHTGSAPRTIDTVWGGSDGLGVRTGSDAGQERC